MIWRFSKLSYYSWLNCIIDEDYFFNIQSLSTLVESSYYSDLIFGLKTWTDSETNKVLAALTMVLLAPIYIGKLLKLNL